MVHIKYIFNIEKNKDVFSFPRDLSKSGSTAINRFRYNDNITLINIT